MPLAASSTPRAADHAKRMVSSRSEEHLLFVCIIYPRGHYYFNMLFFSNPHCLLRIEKFLFFKGVLFSNVHNKLVIFSQRDIQ